MRILITFFVIFNFSFQLSAQQNDRLESAVFIPWSLAESYFNKKLREVRPQSNFEVSKENIKLQIEDIVLPIPKIAVKVYPNLFVHLSIEKKEINLLDSLLEIEIQPFLIDQYVQRKIGDTIINIRIKASCNGFKIVNNQLQGSSQFALKNSGSLFENQILQFSNLSLDWSNDWQISNLECTGLQGATDFFKTSFLRYIENRNNIVHLIEKDVLSSLQSFINIKYTKLNYELSFEAIKQIKVDNLSLSLSSFYKTVENGVVFQALMDEPNFEHNNSAGVFEPSTFFRRASEIRFSDNDKIEVIIEPRTLESILQKKLNTFSYSEQLNLMPEFKRVLNSRWIQFFIWPDLFHYKKKSVFNHVVTGRFNNLKLTGEQVSIEAEIFSNITSHRKGKNWNYIESNLKSLHSGRWGVSSSGIFVELHGKTSAFKISMAEAYVKKFKAATYLPEKIIKSAVVSKLKTINLNLLIPNFQIAEHDLQLNSIFESNKIFRIQFQVKPL